LPVRAWGSLSKLNHEGAWRDDPWSEKFTLAPAEALQPNGYGAGRRNGIAMNLGTLLENIPLESAEEIFDTICSTENVKIERIVSRGHSSPEGFWYDQKKNEFVLVVRGSAGVKMENREEIVVLKVGDYLNIGAHEKHRVEWTDPDCETIWLAVHY
jgi:cupin 2 domain-containing protein